MSGGTVIIVLDGVRREVRAGTTVAAALLNLGHGAFRTSVSGEPRAPLCGMGICYECRVTLDGVLHRRACLELVVDGLEVTT